MSFIARFWWVVLLLGGLALAAPLLTPRAAPPAQFQAATPVPAMPAPVEATAAPAPEPTLTVPQALDRIVSGEQPIETLVTLLSQRPLLLVVGLLLLGLVLYGGFELFRRWTKRGIDAADRRSGGERIDIESEVRREETKQEVVAARVTQRTQQQARTARDQYLQRLEKDMLRLAKIPALGREQHELDLEQVYVPLYIVEREQIESFARYNLGEFGDTDESQARRVAYEAVQESRPVFRLLSEQDQLPPPAPDSDRQVTSRRRSHRTHDEEATTKRLLLVGRAGSGKTTTLHYGALILARAARDGDLSEIRKELHLFTRAPLFPVYARLTEALTYVREHYAQRRAELVGAPARLLLDALDELARRDVPALPIGALRGWIEAGGCLVMLDGLDETGDADERGHAMDLIASLVRDCPRNRYLIASRPFEGLGERLPGFTERHLRPLDANDIRRLLNKLFLALRLPDEREASVARDPDALVPEAAELWRNLERSPRLFDMATNPLLLTSMAVLVEGREPLPVERAKIYEKLVRLTIEAWRKAQLSHDRPGVKVRLYYDDRHKIEESDDSVRLRLQLLAADMLEQERREITLAQARALLRPIYRENNPGLNDERCNDYVRELLYQIALHSGLLQARDSDSLFSFTHFTLQEYLAARHYTEQRSDKEKSVKDLLAHWPEARWRETILLAIGHEATSGSRDTAKTMLASLLATNDPGALLLAGDALDEANARTVNELTRQRLAVCERLRALAFHPQACPDPLLRNRAATLLDRLGADERPELEPEHPGYWATRIAPGPFRMGPAPEIYSGRGAQPAFTARIQQPYALARFPVTNRLYARYLEDLRKTGRMKEYEQRCPHTWPGRSYRPGEGNHPVTGVTWQDAMAFAAWLDAELRKQGGLGAGEQVRLPLETEWERAAAYPVATPHPRPARERGGAERQRGEGEGVGRRAYPWGDWPIAPSLGADGDAALLAGLLDAQNAEEQDDDEDQQAVPGPANTSESGIDGTSAVGIFPDGRADCGAEDLAGNVWEWCVNAYQDYPLPDDLAPETLDTRASIVLRGGSWGNYRSYARCGARLVNNPDDHHDNYGFRVVRLFSSD